MKMDVKQSFFTLKGARRILVRLLHLTVFNIFNKTPVPTGNKTKNSKRNSDALKSACLIYQNSIFSTKTETR